MGTELTTRQRIRRDRGMHELGLASIDAQPHDVLVDTLQQLCLAAGTSDATALPGCMAKHMRASAAMPELETFIDTVCEVSYALLGAALYYMQHVAETAPQNLMSGVA